MVDKGNHEHAGQDQDHLLDGRPGVGFLVQGGDQVGDGDIDEAVSSQGKEIRQGFINFS